MNSSAPGRRQLPLKGTSSLSPTVWEAELSTTPFSTYLNPAIRRADIRASSMEVVPSP